MPQSQFADGFRFLQEGRFADAVAALQDVLKQQPDLAEAHYNLGNAHVGARQYALAVASYREAIRLNPNFVQAHTNLGFVYARLGAHGEAVATFRAAIHVQPDFVEAHMTLMASVLALHSFA